jgi:mono/diheme cytochrome c family protein
MNALVTSRRWWTIAAAAVALMCSASAARADRIRMPGTSLNAYRQECASCHMAYPAGLLPAESWRRIISSLDKHYGTDASLDAQTAREIEQWLIANAAMFKRVREVPAENRITRSSWFAREHREIPARVWQRVSVRSPANCTACHARTEQGRFSEHEVSVPR